MSCFGAPLRANPICPASLPFAATLCLVLTLARHPTLPRLRAKPSYPPHQPCFRGAPSCSLCVLPGWSPFAPTKPPCLSLFRFRLLQLCAWSTNLVEIPKKGVSADSLTLTRPVRVILPPCAKPSCPRTSLCSFSGGFSPFAPAQSVLPRSVCNFVPGPCPAPHLTPFAPSQAIRHTSPVSVALCPTQAVHCVFFLAGAPSRQPSLTAFVCSWPIPS